MATLNTHTMSNTKTAGITLKRAHLSGFSTTLLASGLSEDVTKKLTIKAAAAYDAKQKAITQAREIVMSTCAAAKA